MKIEIDDILKIYEEEDSNLKAYLQTHWLSKEEYVKEWVPIKNKIFNNDFEWFPDMVFNESYILRPLISGAVLIEEDYSDYLKVFEYFSQTEFVIIKDSLDYMGFKFNVSESWNDIFNANSKFLMNELFCFADNFYLFDKSGKWGKYTANEHENWVDVIGFKPEYLDLFRKYFPISEEEKKDVEEALPEYRNKIVW
ncbi:hypothetical protein NMK71_01460 [Weeksellaceae bacterium KMM 9713]|uniref:Uncharacterized protein n=1 Tax=Profundicola chukchiensis TaxID=2961959 RepID=A0A9X4N1V4_9FLAO|nr:hypothetical protein [Profundicola chukchiensis]MDG4945069.1 hypothetical protein [Profundicola chukchiensis]